MVEEKLTGFKQVKTEIETGYRTGANILITTFPGYSVNRYLKKIAESAEFDGLVYINTSGKELGKYNLLDFDFVDNFKESLAIVEHYVKQAKLDQKFTVFINAPWSLNNETFEKSYLGTHHYRTFKYKKPEIETAKLFAINLGVELNDTELKKFYALAGGVGRLGKFLLLHRELLEMEPKEILKNEEVVRMVKYLCSVYTRVSDEELEDYGVIENGKFSSGLVDEYFKNNISPNRSQIKINRDLSVYEFGDKTTVITGGEADLLRFMVNNDGVIKKDEVAEVKWGDKSYVEFSDEAIKKTMQRLSEKLEKHRIEAIHGYGYKLILK